MNVLLLCLLMAVGVTQPGGAGTTIFVYDDASSASGTGYTFAEIAAAFGADFVANGTGYASAVDLQVGDTGVGTATTTLRDNVGSIVKWAAGKTLKNRGTQTTSWFFSFGTKIGSGNQASGTAGPTLVFGAATVLTGTHAHYGCTFRQTTGAMQFGASADGVGEFVNCLCQSTAAGVAPINLGLSSVTRLANLYNVDISHTTANQMASNFNSVLAERISFGCSAPSTFLVTSAPGVAVKDAIMFGSPTQSDLRWSTSVAVNWKLIRPIWTGNAPKFTAQGSGPSLVQGPAVEYWRYDVKVVDGTTGSPISGIPVRLTDTLGNAQVFTTTGSDGQLTFGSGLTSMMVAVMDHYVPSGTTYAQRHRSPFLVEVNQPSMAGYNSNYAGQRYYMKWPGYESVTTSSGSFEDVGDTVWLIPAGGAATTWVERSVA